MMAMVFTFPHGRCTTLGFALQLSRETSRKPYFITQLTPTGSPTTERPLSCRMAGRLRDKEKNASARRFQHCVRESQNQDERRTQSQFVVCASSENSLGTFDGQLTPRQGIPNNSSHVQGSETMAWQL